MSTRRPLEGQHIGYVSHCTCAVCDADPLRTLEMHARRFVEAVGDSAAVAAMRLERDELAKRCASMNAEMIARNEDYRRLFVENEDNKSRYWIAQLETDRLNVARKDLREMLEWLDRSGGLGADVHDRIRRVLDGTK